MKAVSEITSMNLKYSTGVCGRFLKLDSIEQLLCETIRRDDPYSKL